MASLVSFACSTERSLRPADVVLVLPVGAVDDVAGTGDDAELLDLSVLFLITLPSCLINTASQHTSHATTHCLTLKTHRLTSLSLELQVKR